MAGNRLDMKDVAEIRRLWKMGLTNRQIAKASGGKIHRNTVNKNEFTCVLTKQFPTQYWANIPVDCSRVNTLREERVPHENCYGDLMLAKTRRPSSRTPQATI